MAHGNARLTVLARWELVQLVLGGCPQAEAARQFRVSRPTVNKWVRRYRVEGRDGLADRSCRPRVSARQTRAPLAEAICEVRRRLGWGPHRISWALGVARSTVYAVLRRAGLHRMAWLHRATRQVVRYEYPRPGGLLHLDVKKLGRVPPGGGKRFLPGFQETRSGPQRSRGLGLDYLHVAVDDHSRYAYVEALPDERGSTTAAFLQRALDHFESLGVRVQRLLTDNAKSYAARPFLAVVATHGLRLLHTRPYRPQTNGKAEAFNKILQAEWAYLRPYASNAERLASLGPFLTYYNEQRPHGGIGGTTPHSRLFACQ